MSQLEKFDNIVVAKMAEAGFYPVEHPHSPQNQDAYIREFRAPQVGRMPAIIVASGLELMQNNNEPQLENLAGARVKAAIAFGDGSER
jgi:hypothetical protein